LHGRQSIELLVAERREVTEIEITASATPLLSMSSIWRATVERSLSQVLVRST